MQRRCDDSQNEEGDIQSIRYYMTAVRGLERNDQFLKEDSHFGLILPTVDTCSLFKCFLNAAVNAYQFRKGQ